MNPTEMGLIQLLANENFIDMGKELLIYDTSSLNKYDICIKLFDDYVLALNATHRYNTNEGEDYTISYVLNHMIIKYLNDDAPPICEKIKGYRLIDFDKIIMDCNIRRR